MKPKTINDLQVGNKIIIKRKGEYDLSDAKVFAVRDDEVDILLKQSSYERGVKNLTITTFGKANIDYTYNRVGYKIMIPNGNEHKKDLELEMKHNIQKSIVVYVFNKNVPLTYEQAKKIWDILDLGLGDLKVKGVK